jgi:uncharacterized lipoprotein YmbA
VRPHCLTGHTHVRFARASACLALQLWACLGAPSPLHCWQLPAAAPAPVGGRPACEDDDY